MPAAAYRRHAGTPATDPTDDPTTVDGTATVVTVTGRTSSIDPSTVTALRCRYAWVNDGSELVPIALLAGFAGVDTEFPDAKIQRIAKYKHPVTGRRYLPIAVTMRGRLTPTTPDAGGVDCVRDSTDIADILDHVVSLVGASSVFGSGKSCILAGFSTGAHDALLFARRFPDRVLGLILQWPNFDFLDATDGYYAIVGEATRTNYLDVWLGDLRTRPNASAAYVLNHYRACDPISGLGEFLALEGAPPVWIIADADDPAVPLPDHQRLIQACQTMRSGSGQTHVHVSTSASAYRYRHNEAHASAGNIWSERLWAMPLLGPELAEWRFPRAGKLRVLGYLETRADTDRPGFKAWLGAATAPRTSNVGGQGFVADLEYDDCAREYRFTPITTQSGYAQILRAADDRSVVLTAGTPLRIDLNEAPAFADMAAAGMAHDFTAEAGTHGTAIVSSIDDQIGALVFYAPTVVGTTNAGAAGLYGAGGTLNGLNIKLNVGGAGETTLVLNGATNTASSAALLTAIHGQWADVTATIVATHLVLTNDAGGSIVVGAGTANAALGLTAGTYTNAPTLGTDGDGKKYLSFVAATKDMFLLDQLAFDPRTDFTAAFVVYTSASSAFFFAESHHGTLAELRIARNTTVEAKYLLDGSGTYGTDSTNGIGGQAFSAGAKHVLLLRRRTVGGVSYLDVSIDGSAWDTSEILADTFTTTGTNTTTLGAGWANSGGAYWQFLTGRIYRVAWVAGLAKSDAGCAGIVARLALDHSVTLP
jgi:pimeloyl-ACP methyl ester carboxylesterase